MYESNIQNIYNVFLIIYTSIIMQNINQLSQQLRKTKITFEKKRKKKKWASEKL